LNFILSNQQDGKIDYCHASDLNYCKNYKAKRNSNWLTVYFVPQFVNGNYNITVLSTPEIFSA